MTALNTKNAEEVRKEIESDRKKMEQAEFDGQAKDEIEWFTRYSSARSKDEVLMAMARSLVRLRARDKVFNFVLGSIALGALCWILQSISSSNWFEFSVAIIILVIDLVIVIKLHKKYG